MWKIEQEEDYFRIYDSHKDVAGYFDPDYGELFPKEKEAEIIEKMHKNHDTISGGYLMVPMVKFGIFDPDGEMNFDVLEKQLDLVNERLSRWKDFILGTKSNSHSIRVSHTDQDMLSIIFRIKFEKPTPLEKNKILAEIEPILNSIQEKGLL